MNVSSQPTTNPILTFTHAVAIKLLPKGRSLRFPISSIGSLPALRFNEFEAVAPRIVGVKAASAGERIVVGDFSAVRNQIFAELVEFCHQKSGMSFLCGPEIGFHADMELLIPTLEPATTSRGESSGLFDFTQPEKRAIEFAGRSLAAFWSRQLNVVNSYDHCAYLVASIPPPANTYDSRVYQGRGSFPSALSSARNRPFRSLPLIK